MHPQGFHLWEVVERDGVVRVGVVGELDVATADIVVDRLRALGHRGCSVVLDLSSLRFIDARGLRAVIVSVTDALAFGWELRVDRNVSDCVARVVDLTGAAAYVWPPGDATVRTSSRIRGSGGRLQRGRRPPIRRVCRPGLSESSVESS